MAPSSASSETPQHPENGQPQNPDENSSEKAASAPHRMSARNRLLIFLTAWLIVLMPFLFWWNTWFGRQLSDKQVTAYLNDEKHPRHIQHALVQIGERMGRRTPGVVGWYPDLLRLASHPVEEVRNTDAWVMGQDASVRGFHEALLKMLQDSSRTVQGNAALSLVRFGDASGHAQIVALLQPARIVAPTAGRVLDADKVGTAIHQGGLLAKLQNSEETTEIRSPIAGRIRSLSVRAGANVAAGSELATVDPGDEQVWEALRALYLIGQAEDLSAVLPYERELPEIPDRIRQQAILTEKAIRNRATAHP
jgi:biotin carboxyl carrier protein